MADGRWNPITIMVVVVGMRRVPPTSRRRNVTNNVTESTNVLYQVLPYYYFSRYASSHKDFIFASRVGLIMFGVAAQQLLRAMPRVATRSVCLLSLYRHAAFAICIFE